jgi:hypothetical protein
MADSTLGWIIYRIYVPDKGKDRQGGVDLPAVTLVAQDGSRQLLSPCSFGDFATAANHFKNSPKWPALGKAMSMPLTVSARPAEMHRAIAGSELVTIPEAGHLANLEQPDQFDLAMAHFLDHRV